MTEPSSTQPNDQQQQTGTGDSGQTETNATDTAGAAAASALAPSTPSPSQPQPFVRPPPSQSFDPAAVFMEAYDCAKLNNNWNKVSSSLMIHPEWLTKIPEGRKWTMLHQIVFSGNVMHLNEVLALQANNPQFRLLCETADHKTVREVASERAHIHPQMMRRIERLVAVDQLLNNAKDRKWGLVKQCITLQPDIVNEKPPYRRFYLAHHLAYVGELNIFKELSTICHFKLDLLAENKTISQIAREHNHIAFAEYIEGLTTTATDESTENPNDETDLPPPSSGHGHYSPGFYENPGISFIPLNVDLDNLFPAHTNHYHQPHHTTHNNHMPSSDVVLTHSLAFGGQFPLTTTIQQHSDVMEEDDNNDNKSKKSVQPKPTTPQMSDEEQAAYEKNVMNNITKMSKQNLLNSITCCITKSILHDPVVAADGFTYEREAIENWFQNSNRSPMTNQELENLELKPNYAIKAILQLLQDPNNSNPT